MNENVGIVIVSHSENVARGTADMVRQMVGPEVPLAWCGGNSLGGLGTDVQSVMNAVKKVWSWLIWEAQRPTAKWRSRCCLQKCARLASCAMRRSSKVP
jgi:hypothetical protein